MTRDVALGRAATRALGLHEDFFELLSIISVNRTPTSQGGLGQQMSDSERSRIREKYRDRKKYGSEQLLKLIQSLPRDVLFVLRSNSLVRSLNTELGANVGTRFRIFGSSAVVGLSTPTPSSLPPSAYFLEEMRDSCRIQPGVGRVLQKRQKRDLITNPEASLNKSTASEAFLFSSAGGFGVDKRGVWWRDWKEAKRQILVIDLRVRLWMVDAAIEWAIWARTRLPLPAMEEGGRGVGGIGAGVGGETMVEKQLHVNEGTEEERERVARKPTVS